MTCSNWVRKVRAYPAAGSFCLAFHRISMVSSAR